MPGTLVEHAGSVRCYQCGSTVIFSVCHHCARPMCQDHSPPAFRDAGRPVRVPNAAADDQARPASREFAGMKLGGTREAVYHCADHAHIVRSNLIGYIGVGVAALGVIVLILSVLPGLVLMLVGAGLAGVTFGLPRLRDSWPNATRPPLPLVPDVNKVTVVEELTGTVRLDTVGYKSHPESVAGEIKVNMSANDGRRGLELYRKKHGRRKLESPWRKDPLPQDQPVQFSAGFALLEGELGLRFDPDQPAVLAGGTGLSFGDTSADTHDLFAAIPGRALGDWTLAAAYRPQDGRTPKDIPLWIVPSLVPGSDRRTLEMDLHWNQLGPRDNQRDLQLFDLIELEVPSRWGNVEGILPGRAEISRSGQRRIIKWQRLAPADNDGQDPLPPNQRSRSRTLTIRFEQTITEEPGQSDSGTRESAEPAEDEQRLTLSGNVEATFAGTLSGLTGIGLYLPGGGRGHQVQVKPQTKVRVHFDVSLGALRYQADRVVPDESNAEDRAMARNKADHFRGVAPDYRAVVELTNKISAEKFYVKSVVEHAPYRDDGRANVVNHVWDISGRWYEGVFPIDFDINIRGDEVGQGGYGVITGNTAVQVTVKGAYATGTATTKVPIGDSPDSQPGSGEPDAADVDDELLRKIEETWTVLHDMVTETFAGRASLVNGSRAIPAPGRDIVQGELIVTEEDADADTEPDPGIVDGEVVRSAVVLQPFDDDRSYRLAELRDQRKAADDAVIAGKISEEVYRGIVARIQADRRELGEIS